MKIMILADEPAGVLWEHLDKTFFEGVELIVSCGDLSPKYLDFIVTFAPCSVIYVRGNHDDVYAFDPPSGCDCIEDDVFVYRGVRFAGLGGSMEYTEGKNQYKESDMKKRAKALEKKIRRYHGIDVLVTHAPAKGLGDAEDLPHQGFQTFRKMLDKYKPRYMFHGHVHMNYGPNIKRTLQYDETTIVNGYRYHILDIEVPERRAGIHEKSQHAVDIIRKIWDKRWDIFYYF